MNMKLRNEQTSFFHLPDSPSPTGFRTKQDEHLPHRSQTHRPTKPNKIKNVKYDIASMTIFEIINGT